MKKIIISASFLASSTFCFAQFLPGTDPDDLYWNNGQVGIGISDPKAKLDINLGTNYMYDDVSGIRLSYPIPSLSSDPAVPTVNTSVFEIRQKAVVGNVYNTRFVVNTKGNVGIGLEATDALLDNQRLVVTDNDHSKIDLHVMGFTLIDGRNASLLLGQTTGAVAGEWGIEYNQLAGGLNFWKPFGSNNYGNYYMFIADNGKVSIGLDPDEINTPDKYRLYVADGILTERVKVALRHTNDWADYVFKADYKLMGLQEVEAYIMEHEHLPGIPSAEEVKASGIDVATMDAKLLEKIEELTLYMIQLQKENEVIKAELNALKK